MAGVRLQRWWVASGRSLPSPRGQGSRVGRVNPQVSKGSDPTDPSDDPTAEEDVAEYDWGSVSGRGNKVEVVLRRAGEPAPSGQDLDGWVAQQLGKLRPAEIIREARRRFGASESTVKRRMRRARGRR
ncbi:hypothetical protein Pa4123_26040 [Phytohabitans aurantiacus]|uniref:RNA polymerase sigma-70 region 4 domain-containing protein n=2 Tax=Phytohabitans aurantiacus TaxID=3016789 RepID=A0ABQ5QSF2_9ACTN|nr:hypothetical protein Pa4123_26040 [Phytohabitans aurantiacus]